MLSPALNERRRNKRVRAILLTDDHRILFIKRVKPGNRKPYWIAPGGGVESSDASLQDALRRELHEELGAQIEIVDEGFVLRHRMGGKNLEEHFFICRLVDYDLSLRHGPEFKDPARGEYIPDAVPLTAEALSHIYIKTSQLKVWLLSHLSELATI